MSAGAGELHLAVCRRFGQAVRSADGRWDRRSPCDAWDARGVLEHVIGFHNVLLLRPLAFEPDLPHADPQRRWELTFDGLREVLRLDGLSDRTVEVPAVGKNAPRQMLVAELIPRLTQDVLVHTWDLARAVEADDRLNPRWCRRFLDALPADPDALSRSGMFAAPIAVDDGVDVQARLLARLGRDPAWRITEVAE
jgi:uncharacterized protein (TIGR03086 family)